MPKAFKMVLASLVVMAGLSACTREKPPVTPQALPTVAVNSTGAAPLTSGAGSAISGTVSAPSTNQTANPTSAPNPGPGGTYTVQAGDTLNGLAQKFGTTVDQIMKTNGLASDQVQTGQKLTVPSGQASTGAQSGTGQAGGQAGTGQTGGSSASSGFYVVQEGDTLNKIAVKLNVSIVDIVRANNLQNADAIYIGQRLTVPGSTGATGGNTGDTSGGAAKPKTYTVKAGDSLGTIAGRLGISAANLAKANHITNPDSISVGQVLVVPSQ